jgi:hypothetical protein
MLVTLTLDDEKTSLKDGDFIQISSNGKITAQRKGKKMLEHILFNGKKQCNEFYRYGEDNQHIRAIIVGVIETFCKIKLVKEKEAENNYSYYKVQKK